ncbi:MAG TPA: hypothetical protein VH573_14335 [Mycobacteriales bacterium]|jgi:hypothetical protein
MPVLTLRSALSWLATFAGFPLGGVAGRLVAGPVDGAVPALVGGLVTGAVLGLVQALGLGRTRPAVGAWVLATALGLAAGLGLGAGAVSYGTGTSDLVVQGAVCGAVVGLAQAVVLARRIGPVAAAWPALLAGCWALGWAVTAAIGVEVDLRFTVFGSSGAVVVTALTLVLPAALARSARTAVRS